jgi:prepilin-type N-terminal cleavage/methylation domain-containing protein
MTKILWKYQGILMKRHNQTGFTLIELIVAIALTAAIASGITAAINQVFSINSRSSNHMLAVRQVQTAGYWVSHDSQMAQSTTLTSTQLVLRWTEWNNDNSTVEQTVTYTKEPVGTKYNLRRKVGTGPDTIIAQNLSAVTWSWISDVSMNFTVTAIVGNASTASSETRTYEISPRSGL